MLRGTSLWATAAVAVLVIAATAARVLASAGDLDPTFGSGGIVITDIHFASQLPRVGLALQPDGKLVLASGTDCGSFVILRYDSSGALDPSFGTAGRASPASGRANAVALQPDGKILAAGSGPDGLTVVRLAADGSPDGAFGTAGIVQTAPGSYAEADAIMLMPDGRIVVAGSVGLADFLLVRFESNGRLDSSFGNGGIVDTHFASTTAFADALLVLPDGTLVAGGWANPDGHDFALAKYTTNGQIDAAFGTSGLVETPFIGADIGVSLAAINALALQDGEIVAVGQALEQNGEIALARYTTTGALDATFGSGGLVDTNVHSVYPGQAVAIQGDGKLVVGGQASSSGFPPVFNGLAVTRYTADGDLDPAFGVEGTTVLQAAPSDLGDDVATALVLQGDGRIVIAGRSEFAPTTPSDCSPDGEITTEYQFVLARFLGDASTTTTTTAPGITSTTKTTFSPTSTSTSTTTSTPSSTSTSESGTTTTSTTLPTPCDLAQLPTVSRDGVLCAISMIQESLQGPPRLDCAAHCKCSLQTPLAHILTLVAAANEGTGTRKCKERLAIVRRATKVLETRIRSLARKHCLTPTSLAPMLVNASVALARRSNALFKSSFCLGVEGAGHKPAAEAARLLKELGAADLLESATGPVQQAGPSSKE
jgi:uncharacterized delta-60 repeat protein